MKIYEQRRCRACGFRQRSSLPSLNVLDGDGLLDLVLPGLVYLVPAFIGTAVCFGLYSAARLHWKLNVQMPLWGWAVVLLVNLVVAMLLTVASCVVRRRLFPLPDDCPDCEAPLVKSTETPIFYLLPSIDEVIVFTLYVGGAALFIWL